MNPLVSVLMTSYNREKFISEAIEGVLKSSYSNIELIIVDDCSTDKTASIARQYLEKDRRVKLFINEENLGQFGNRNKAASYATGDFILYADSDDILFPDAVSNCINAMHQFPESSFGMFYMPTGAEPFMVQSKEAIRRHFFERTMLAMGPGGTIIRTAFFRQLGGYPLSYGVPGDMYFNLKAACASPVVMLPFEFMHYRRHEGQEINNTYDYMLYNYLYLEDALKVLPLGLSHKEIDWLKKKNKRRFFVNVIKYFASTFDTKKTARALKLSRFNFKDVFVAVFQ